MYAYFIYGPDLLNSVRGRARSGDRVRVDRLGSAKRVGPGPPYYLLYLSLSYEWAADLPQLWEPFSSTFYTIHLSAKRFDFNLLRCSDLA